MISELVMRKISFMRKITKIFREENKERKKKKKIYEEERK